MSAPAPSGAGAPPPLPPGPLISASAVAAPPPSTPLLPARFWPRYVAWSLDAALMAMATCVIGASHWRYQALAAKQAYAAMNARAAELMADSVLNDLDFGGFAQQLMTDPAMHAAGLASTAALTSLIFGWIFLFALFGLIYEVGFVAFSPWQATPGKRVLGLRITDIAGRRLSPGRAVLRYLGGGLSWLLLNLGHVIAMAKPEYRALHDRLAGARVLRDAHARMPLWAWAWVAVQVIVGFSATFWLMRAMQAAMDAALAQSGAL
ncbi:MAG: RDD family protein [Lysobacter sp.]|nr:RDD family protein [Lysobacter sp.]